MITEPTFNRWDLAEKAEEIRRHAIELRGRILADDHMGAIFAGTAIANLLAEIQTDNACRAHNAGKTKKAIAAALEVPVSFLRELRRAPKVTT